MKNFWGASRAPLIGGPLACGGRVGPHSPHGPESDRGRCVLGLAATSLTRGSHVDADDIGSPGQRGLRLPRLV